MDNLVEMDAVTAAGKLADGEITSEQLVSSCIAAIEQKEDVVRAWAWLDKDNARAQARALDARRAAGETPGPLQGLPVGLKDIIDTADMPTENGTRLDQGRQPGKDSAIAQRLREAGGVILGKTVTTELAVFHPGKTTNPHDPGRTPGGSSSGSAAAVAAHMVPLSVGTQTTGSVVRPASFCGIYGFKPSHGVISRTGVLPQSPKLDTIGVFGRSLRDVALLAGCLGGPESGDEDTLAHEPMTLFEATRTNQQSDPRFAFVKSCVWENADEATRHIFEKFASFLGKHCNEVDLPAGFSDAHQLHRALMVADFAINFAGYYGRGKDQLSEVLRGLIEEGQDISPARYHEALDGRQALRAELDNIFEQFDAIITPCTLGEAPLGLNTTGDPQFCTIWTFCGVPALSLPLFKGANGMPVGLQLVGKYGGDERLLQTAHWLIDMLAKTPFNQE